MNFMTMDGDYKHIFYVNHKLEGNIRFNKETLDTISHILKTNNIEANWDGLSLLRLNCDNTALLLKIICGNNLIKLK